MAQRTRNSPPRPSIIVINRCAGYDADMERWLQDLEIWAWRYVPEQRNYDGCHFTAKKSACDAILRCLELLSREHSGASRAIPLKPLKQLQEAKITGGLRYRCFKKLRISVAAQSEDLQQMCIRDQGDTLLCEFTSRSIGEFWRGVEDVRRGIGDYSIGPERPLGMGKHDRESEDLWFWPCFGHLRVVE